MTIELTSAERGHRFAHYDRYDTYMFECYSEADVERILADRIAAERQRITEGLNAAGAETGAMSLSAALEVVRGEA